MQTKSFLLNQRWLLTIILLLSLSISFTWGADQTVTWTASAAANLGSTISSVNGTATGTITTSNASYSYNWSYTRTLKSGEDYMGYGNAYGIQLGKNGGVENVEFTTSNIPGTIKTVSITCSSYQAKHNVSISVNGTSYVASTATASGQSVAEIKNASAGSSSGTITISITGGTRYVCVKSISVTYNNDGGASCTVAPTVTAPSNSSFWRAYPF